VPLTATKQRLPITDQIVISTSGAAAMVVPQVADMRVVVMSMLLGATAADAILVYEGTTATPAGTLKIGSLPVSNTVPSLLAVGPPDCLIRTSVGKGVAIDVVGGATVTGSISYYYEGTP
jgi:hypothetical protein